MVSKSRNTVKHDEIKPLDHAKRNKIKKIGMPAYDPSDHRIRKNNTQETKNTKKVK